MRSLKKVGRISRSAFLNALRLHKDSIFLFNRHSYPTAFQLSIIAQEEIGKSFLMEEHIFQAIGINDGNKGLLDEITIKAMFSHRVKQGWFSRQADDFFKYHGKKYPAIIRLISSGKLEEMKQNATYVGLTKNNGKADPKGKIIIPEKRIKEKDAVKMITRVNDYVIDLIEGVRRGVYCIDSEELNEIMLLDTAHELERLWPIKTKSSEVRINKLRKLELEIDEE